MMQQLSSLKKKTEEQKPLIEQQKEKEKELAAEKEEERIAALLETKNTGYKVKNVDQLKTAHTLGVTSDQGLVTKEVPTVIRPEEVQESRVKLPVCGMEQEIVEKIKKHNVLILCGEILKRGGYGDAERRGAKQRACDSLRSGRSNGASSPC